MQAIKRIVKRKSIKAVAVPETFGENVEILILPILAEGSTKSESEQFMKLQEQSGFSKHVRADPQEDVWNDI